MALILRKIRKSKWYKHSGIPWLPAGEIQADALVDLKTEDNKLSVWHVHDDESNLNDLLAALGAKCDTVANLDYAILDAEVVSSLSLKLIQTDGDTPHKKVNDSWHRELTELSASKVLDLAKAIFTGAKTQRLTPRNLLLLIRNGVAAGDIDAAKLSPNIKNKLTTN